MTPSARAALLATCDAAEGSVALTAGGWSGVRVAGIAVPCSTVRALVLADEEREKLAKRMERARQEIEKRIAACRLDEHDGIGGAFNRGAMRGLREALALLLDAPDPRP